MIHIAIIDQNRIFRESLRVILEQVEGFRVIHDSSDGSSLRNREDLGVQLLILDSRLPAENYRDLLQRHDPEDVQFKILRLAMFREELDAGDGEVEVMLKSSGKQELVNRIKNMTGLKPSEQIIQSL